MNFFDGLFFSQAESRPGDSSRIHNEPSYYSIQFNYHGRMRLQVNDGRIWDVEGPYAFLTYPGAVFEYGAVGQEARHHNFICTYGQRIQHYLSSGLFTCSVENPLVRIHNAENFLQTMLAIMALVRQPGATPPRAVLLFEDLLLQMHEEATQDVKSPPYQSEYLNHLIRKLCDTPEQNWNFQAEADRCHVTATHFRRLFKQMTGMPPQQFLIHNRLRKASNLLINGEQSIKEIADEVGMSNVFYFSRLFKQKFQTSPKLYRKEFGRHRVGEGETEGEKGVIEVKR